MANKKITDLQLRSDVDPDVNFAVDDGIQSYRVTALQVLTYILTRANMLVGAVARLMVVTKTGAYTLVATDDVVLANAAGGAFTLTLPTAASISGRVFIVKKTDSSANVVTVDGDGSETIDGETTFSLYNQYESVRVMSDGTNWVVI